MRKPDKYELTLLYLLYTGADFKKAAAAGGSYGLKAGFACTLEGWIDQGHITTKGRAVVESNREDIQAYLGKRLPDKAGKVEITVVKESRIFYLPAKMPSGEPS